MPVGSSCRKAGWPPDGRPQGRQDAPSTWRPHADGSNAGIQELTNEMKAEDGRAHPGEQTLSGGTVNTRRSDTCGYGLLKGHLNVERPLAPSVDSGRGGEWKLGMQGSAHTRVACGSVFVC